MVCCGYIGEYLCLKEINTKLFGCGIKWFREKIREWKELFPRRDQNNEGNNLEDKKK